MNTSNEKLPNPKEIEKEISDFLSKKYGDQVKMISPVLMPLADFSETDNALHKKKTRRFDFDLKPELLISYLDQYLIKQDQAKQILATKICTHFKRIKYQASNENENLNITGGVKNNVLMLGPTGVGKTYMIKLIAAKLGVPMVKGDATKFSETGYVGGDVEDLVRDLVRESNNDIELAEHGIIYIDEIDKIASNSKLIGSDISRTGVQRALLKPMEETEVELKVPHDPISMIQEVEQFRKTGKREKRSINTKNILFIMSGAFNGLGEIIKKRTHTQSIGFGGSPKNRISELDLVRQVKAEDLINYGFESEFIGRLPVKAIFEPLAEADLQKILHRPNNPVLLNKKLDFAAYDIDIKFSNDVLKLMAQKAYSENTGARGLVSVIEQLLIPFETRLPSTTIKRFPVTVSSIKHPEETLHCWLAQDHPNHRLEAFKQIFSENKSAIMAYLNENRDTLMTEHDLPLTDFRIQTIAEYHCNHVTEIGNAIQKIKSVYEQIKKIEFDFYREHAINIVLEEDAVDELIRQLAYEAADIKDIYQNLSSDFEYGLKLIKEKTHRNRFFLPKKALINPENFLNQMIKSEFAKNGIQVPYSFESPDYRKNNI